MNDSSKQASDSQTPEDCHLCGGTGEVVITPYGQPDSAAATFGCPACIQADRDTAEAMLERTQSENEALAQRLAVRIIELLQAVQGRLAAEQQRAQLLVALELLADAVGASCDADQDEMAVKPAMKRARAAIAAVKGGAAC